MPGHLGAALFVAFRLLPLAHLPVILKVRMQEGCSLFGAGETEAQRGTSEP